MNFPDIASFLVTHIWQTTLFGGVVWLLNAMLLRENRPKTRYALWLAASLKFVIPFAALSALGGKLGWFRHGKSVASSGLIHAIDQMTQRVTAGPRVSVVASPANVAPSHLLPDALLALWICGAAGIAIYWWLRARHIGDAVQNATPFRIYRGVEVRSSAALRERGLEPGVCGWLRPAIIMPEGIDELLTTAEFESILAHEYAHARRRDNLAAASHMTVQALFWFHPMTWWIGRQMMLERERACDEDVVRSGSDPSVYAQGVLNVCKAYVESRLACVPGVTSSDLKRRIEEIMQRHAAHELTAAKRAILAIAAAAAVTAPVIFGFIHAPVVRAQVPSSFTGLATSTDKKFDVATIKENASGDPGWLLGKPNRGAERIRNLELRKIVASSFRIQDKMVFGPDWLEKVRYDIDAKGPNPEASNPQVWEMMRSLLAERFHLKYHLETREMPIYMLSIAKGGPKLVKGEEGRCKEEIEKGNANCGSIEFLPSGVGIVNTPIGGLTGALARTLQDRPIVDRTGLTDRYDVRVMWMPDDPRDVEKLAELPPEIRPPDMSMFQAFEKQAGLKLEPTRSGVQVVVIDSIDKPTPN
jgi:uncharacterized protein (TIGR03435 family)